MKVKQIKDRGRWSRFLSRRERRSFPQSWEWGEFQEKLENQVWRVGVFEGNSLKGVAQVVSQTAKRGKFLIVPHGPVFKEDREKYFPPLVDYLASLAKRNTFWFVRIAPFWLKSKKTNRLLDRVGLKAAPDYIHAERTWNLGLSFSEEELISNMRKTTRWSIRKAKKEGVKVEISQNSKDIAVYKKLERATVKRKEFVPYSLEFEKKLFSVFAPENKIAIFKGIYKEETLSAAIVIFWKKRAFYYLGASRLKYSKVPVSHLVQWEAIKEAKKRGCKLYNFWGIAPTDSKKHPWWGLTFFKRGFGGYSEKLAGTWDLRLDPRYWISWSIETIRRKIRGV